ncbi:MAG: hypothetical protein ACOY99_12230 [Pseudomonadota bacterium]
MREDERKRPKKPRAASEKNARGAKLGRALRDNLQRRKAQARARTKTDAPTKG